MTETIQLVTEGGIAATHAEVEDFRPLVGPSTGDEFNTIKAALIPIACWRVDDIRFEFDSSFIQPGIETELKHLAELLKKHPPASMAKNASPPDTVGCPLSIFGHADPLGDDEYNKQLSGRRAVALYGLLTRDVELWDELFKNPMGNDKWGKPSLQTMVKQTTVPQPTEEPDVSSIENNSSQRKALYVSYMDKLCEQVDETGKPKQDKAGKPETLKLEKTDFLAQGQDKGGKGDYQGCSEFNPILLFSQEEEKAFQQGQDKSKRNEANAPNRRVMVLIFRKGTKVDPNRWPCPRAKEGMAGCKKRFWSDGEKRRTTKLANKQRNFEEAKDTFACRFYNRLTTRSPCERIQGEEELVLRLLDFDRNPCGNINATILFGSRSRVATSQADGILRALIPVGIDEVVIHYQPKNSATIVQWPLRIHLSPVQDDIGAEGRLLNLGYPISSDRAFALFMFQGDHEIPETGVLDDVTRAKLAEVHDIRGA
jgi:hypothetical protein